MASRRDFIRQSMGFAAGAISAHAFGVSPVAAAKENRAPSPAAPAGKALEAKSPDGVAISGCTYGDPSHPEILFIHGLNQSRLCWNRQIVGELSRNFRIATFDLRGHGASGKPTDPAAYANGALWGDDVNAVIKAAGMRKPTLVGWSLGGMIIGHYLVKYGTESIAGVSLVNAMTKFDSNMLTANSLSYVPKLGSPDLAERTDTIAKFLSLCFAKEPPKEDFNRMLVYNGMAEPAMNSGLFGMSDKGFEQAFASVQKMQLIHSRHDALIKVGMAEQMLKINKRAKLSVFEDTGHASFYDDAPRFNRELAAFVRA